MVSLEDARRVIAAAEKKSKEIGQPMNVAVVDEGGNLVGHEAGGEADTPPMRFNKGRCQREHLDQDGDDRNPEEHPPQSSPREFHDPTSTGSARM